MQLYIIKWESPKREPLPNEKTRKRQPPMDSLLAKSVLLIKENHLEHNKNYNEYQYNYKEEENHLYIKWIL